MTKISKKIYLKISKICNKKWMTVILSRDENTTVKIDEPTYNITGNALCKRSIDTTAAKVMLNSHTHTPLERLLRLQVVPISLKWTYC